jgi:hypothetical protein
MSARACCICISVQFAQPTAAAAAPSGHDVDMRAYSRPSSVATGANAVETAPRDPRRAAARRDELDYGNQGLFVCIHTSGSCVQGHQQHSIRSVNGPTTTRPNNNTMAVSSRQASAAVDVVAVVGVAAGE